MDYSNKMLNKLFDKLYLSYQQRASHNPLQKWVYYTLLITWVNYLGNHSELFETPKEYNLFLEEHHLTDKDVLLATSFIAPMFSQQLYTRISPQINTLFNRNIYTRRYDFDKEYLLQQTRHDLAQFQTQQLTDFITNRLNYLGNTNKTFTSSQLNQTLDLYRKQLQNICIQQEQQKDHVLKYTNEILKPVEEQHKYKQWIWCPNPHTRHTTMADKIVPLQEKFHVHSDSKYCQDAEMMYPLDPNGPPCQCVKCKCTYILVNKKRSI